MNFRGSLTRLLNRFILHPAKRGEPQYYAWYADGSIVESNTNGTPVEQEPQIPTVVEALTAVLHQPFSDDLRVTRINIQPLATGEVAYMLHPPGDLEAIGGVARVGEHV